MGLGSVASSANNSSANCNSGSQGSQGLQANHMPFMGNGSILNQGVNQNYYALLCPLSLGFVPGFDMLSVSMAFQACQKLLWILCLLVLKNGPKTLDPCYLILVPMCLKGHHLIMLLRKVSLTQLFIFVFYR